MGVAVSVGVGKVASATVLGKETNFNVLLVFAALIFTLVPFYHGALRHLHDAYVAEDVGPRKLLFFDYALLILHALVFAILAQIIEKPAKFAYILCSLLFIDIVWGLIIHCRSEHRQTGTAEGVWAFINISALLCAALILMVFKVGFNWTNDDGLLAWILAVIGAVRTWADYRFNWEFYMPPFED